MNSAYRIFNASCIEYNDKCNKSLMDKGNNA